jgi:predicted N-formylglutamate amidohydrolase
MNEVYEIKGQLQKYGILIVGDHASNIIPADVVLTLSSSERESHIAWDIGVAGVADILVQRHAYIAMLARVSRLVVDQNRYCDDDAVIPSVSDGITLHCNQLTQAARTERLNKYYHPYHNALADLITEMSPKLLLSLHSFTPQLTSNPDEKRPWEISVLYNQDDRAARIAIPEFEKAGLCVGDQLPYSGKLLNATMNRHGEGNNIPYLGIEMRQDLVADNAGQARFAALLAQTCQKITEMLGVAA